MSDGVNMKSSRKGLFLAIMLAFCNCYSAPLAAEENPRIALCEPAAPAAPCCQNQGTFYAPLRGYVSQTFGRGLGYNRGYTSLGVFFDPTIQRMPRVRPFVDLRGHVFKNNKWAFNAGGGVRFLVPALRRVFGINTYYDYRRAKRDYHQIGVGLEILGPCYDLRFNSYIPVGHRDHFSHPNVYRYPGGFLAVCRRKQKALQGFDGEICTSLRKLCPCTCGCWDFYIGIGGYGYPGDCGRNANGGMLRLGMNYINFFDFEVRITDDRLFGTRVQGCVAFNFPLYICEDQTCCEDQGICCLECLADQPVERQEIIVVDHERCMWKTNF